MEGFLEIVSGEVTRSNPTLIPLPISRERSSPTSRSAETWFSVGPLPTCDLVLQHHHWEREGFALQWSWRLATWKLLNQSYAPIEVDGQTIGHQQSTPLLRWDSVIRVDGVPMLRFLRRPQRPLLAGQTLDYFPLTPTGMIIGRGDRGKLESNAPRLELDRDILSISSTQAEIIFRDGNYHLINHNDNPAGRTILNGDQSFDERKLNLGDCLEIPNFDYYTFKFDGHGLRHLGFGGALHGRDLTVDVPGARILHSVNLSLHKGELIGIVGGSGQGKSTLMNALCGIVPATDGTVTVDGITLKSPKDVAKVGIGYVPQDDIVHKELTVDLALYYAAQLRLNATRKEILSLLDSVLDVLRLTEHRKKRISNLSGGQRKRVSIASELLTSPEYLFLDEPTSGLDPQTEKVLMGELSVLAKRKRIGVACTTHILQNCHVMSSLAFISRGRLIFCGKPLDAVKFFLFSKSTDVTSSASNSTSGLNPNLSIDHQLPDHLAEDSPEFSEAYLLSNINRIYDIAQDPTKPIEQQNRVAETWEAAYRSEYPIEETTTPQETNPATKSSQQNNRVGLLASLRVLFARQWSILVSSKLNYTFLAAQALLIGFLIGWVDGNSVLQSFLAVIATLWFGCSNGAQQIVAELAIFRRERLAGLSIHGYLFSKVLFLSTLTVVQAVMLYGTLQLSSNFFHHRETQYDAEGEDLRKQEASKPSDEEKYNIPSKKIREFRMAFFDKSWQAIARGDDVHVSSDPTPTSSTANTPTAPESTSEFQDDDFVLEEAVGSMAPTPMNVLSPERIVYINPSGLRLNSLAFKMVEKITFFFGLQENVLGTLGVKQLTISYDAPTPQTLQVSWQIHLLNLLGLRFIALAAAAIVGVMLGLAVSSLVNTPTQSVMWVPLILIPQILFGSFVVTIPEMTASVLAFSRALPSFNLHRIMDVAQVYGRNTTRVTNQTKIPGFIGLPPNDEEIVKWEGKQTNYDKLSDVNKSWQNLLVIRDRIGKREKVSVPSSPDQFVNSLERRPDVLLGKGVQYILLAPARTAILVLLIWFCSCYTTACISLYRRQTGR